jgi:SAM-dependent methyltransferase
MTDAPSGGPNAEQIEYWNQTSGSKWVALQEVIDAQIRPLGLAAMDRARIAPGESVIDIGCGCGDSSLELAERVGAGGSVLGFDLSAVMLARARERARERGISNVSFVQADAQTHRFEGASHDVLFSRFGVMFFADPVPAFTNIRRALVPGARLAFVCWQELKRNAWMLVPVLAISKHVELPPPPEPGSPGPFAFADAERLRGILTKAGFESVSIEPEERTLALAGGGDLDQAVDLALQLGPTGRLLAGAEAAVRDRARESVRDALAPYAGAAGVSLDCAAFVVTARNSSQ